MGQDLKPSISCMDKGKICKYMEQDGKMQENMEINMYDYM